MLIHVPAEYFLEFVFRDELAKIGDEKRRAGRRRVRGMRRRRGRMARNGGAWRAQRRSGEHARSKRQGGLGMTYPVNYRVIIVVVTLPNQLL